MARVQILSKEEQIKFSLPIKFNQAQREYYFVYFTTFFHLFHSQSSTFFSVKQVSKIVA